MASSQPTIQLNGNLYDAKTGRLLATSAPGARPVALDGMVRKISRKNNVERAKVASHGVHANTHKSKTLSRSAVKRPKIVPKVSNNSNPVEISHATNDQAREKRAQQIKKNKFVSRFGFSDISIVPKFASLPVKKAPKQDSQNTKVPIIAHHPSEATNSVLAAIHSATSHNEPKIKKPPVHHRVAKKLKISPKTLNFAASACAVILLGGFIAIQNIPNLAVKMAASRAGVDASLPSYQPTGFALNGKVEYKPGQVSVAYKSRTDDRQFNIVQTASSWNSDALLDNFINTTRRTYQTYQDKGKTIFVYDGSNATWVDGGVWYQIEGNSSLNSDQLLRLASSL
ncbi:MAG: DUF4367 domain-containing protein [Patescibacteria group bacterium]